MQTIYRSEASASLRRVPVWLVGSTGTAPDTDESGGQPQVCWHARGLATVNTAGTLSLVSANAGLYHVELTASEVSALGILSIHYRSATAIANVSFAQVINWDSSDSVRGGLFAFPNVAAGNAGALITEGTGTGQLSLSAGSVGLKAQTHSQATITGINNILAGTYSDVTVRIQGVDYSGLTIKGITNYANISSVTLNPGTHSSVTIQGLSNYANISNVTLHAGTHSAATIQGLSRINSSVTVAPATYSDVTVRIEGVNYSGATIDGVRMLATPAERSIASSFLSTNLGGTRTIRQAFHAIRNRIQLSGSTGTVYLADDTTSDWTFTVSTGTATVYGIDPGIA